MTSTKASKRVKGKETESNVSPSVPNLSIFMADEYELAGGLGTAAAFILER